MNRSKILLVDDHELILTLLERLLEGSNADFLRATNGDQALELARSERPDVIVMDVCMPGKDGLEVCQMIKDDPELSKIRVVLMSAILGDGGLRYGRDEVGADAYFGKPFDGDVVRRSIAALLPAPSFSYPCPC